MAIFGADTVMEDPGISGSLSGSTFSDAANGGTGKSETAETSSKDKVYEYSKML